MFYQKAQDIIFTRIFGGQIRRKLAAQHLGRMIFKPAKPHRVEGLDEEGTFIVFQKPQGLRTNVQGFGWDF